MRTLEGLVRPLQSDARLFVGSLPPAVSAFGAETADILWGRAGTEPDSTEVTGAGYDTGKTRSPSDGSGDDDDREQESQAEDDQTPAGETSNTPTSTVKDAIRTHSISGGKKAIVSYRFYGTKSPDEPPPDIDESSPSTSDKKTVYFEFEQVVAMITTGFPMEWDEGNRPKGMSDKQWNNFKKKNRREDLFLWTFSVPTSAHSVKLKSDDITPYLRQLHVYQPFLPYGLSYEKMMQEKAAGGT